MSTKEKLLERFKRQPTDFTWQELVRLFKFFGFSMNNKGKTSGSRVIFEKENKCYFVHKPHPSNIINKCIMKQVLNYLKNNNFIR
ncbi:MAG: type II toxin-antitoxin system HicA family toxin [Marinilabiliaceae bacterium]|nr:type II toxin-antitoxin system HicA family toxin [Marinilabiliaceae bacterium]